MKYRVRLDLSFSKESDAKSLVDFAKKLKDKAVSLNEGNANEEISNIDYHLCGHDEGKACQWIERLEVRK